MIPKSGQSAMTMRRKSPRFKAQETGRIDTAATPDFRRKLPKVMFYAIPTTDREKWRLLAHFPGSPMKYIASFDSKAEAEEWASGSEAQDWVRQTIASR
jgi:hypothetical protein